MKPETRRLAAILAADVAGYSRLVRADEDGTLASLKALRETVVGPKIAEHHGRVVKWMGDGILAEFASVIDAMRNAIDLQHALADHQAEVPDEQRIRFRIGLNLGDIVIDGEDIHGDGVNVAARLEALSEPGGVCVSDAVYDQVRDRLDAQFEDMGEQRVKNIDRPIRVWRWRPAAAHDGMPATGPNLPDRPSVAVMPFENMSGDPEQSYFSDGITEDIITELSAISGLFVIARHSTFSYRGRPVTLKQIGRELGVRHVLEGSVRKAGERIRVSAQLIDVDTERHLWAERYDRDLEDIFAVQEEVARRVAEALAVALKPQEKAQLGRPLTDNLEVYDTYLRLRATPWPPIRENILSARHAYEHIIRIEPSFVGGHAGKALSHAMAVVFGASDEPEADAEIAHRTTTEALAIDDRFAQAHSALGLALLAKREHDAAVGAARRAVVLAPNDADAHCFLGLTLLFAGEGEAASEAAANAHRADPQFVNGPYLNLLGAALFVAGRYGESVEAFERNVARGGPVGVPMLHFWAASCAALGRHEEAGRIAQQILQFVPQFSIASYGMLQMYKNDADAARLVGYLRDADLPA